MNNLLNEISSRIAGQTETPALDARVLLSHLIGKSQSWVLAHPELTLTPAQQEDLQASLDRLISGVPLPYILGRWEFYGLDLVISSDVLIPRPETEQLVDKALDWLKANPRCRTMIDMGTGSGCIPIALAVNIPDLYVKAIDVSEKALLVARGNLEKYNLTDRVEFIQGNLWDTNNDPDKFVFHSIDDHPSSGADLITANLPYIPTKLLHELKVFGREPDLALDGGTDGLVVIRLFLNSAPQYLKPGGLLLMEVESSLAPETTELIKVKFPGAEIRTYQDLAGLDRIIEVRQVK